MTTDKLKIFLVDSNKASLENQFGHLAQSGYNNVYKFDNGRQCTDKLTERPDIIFLTYGQSAGMALEALHQIKAFNPGIQVVLLPATAGKKGASEQHNQYVTSYIDHILSRLPQTRNAA
ncbi:hypothetical protein HQ865_03115 [Mucilaginibacter mali]|uniref:Response regulatory domain-containing protein n=1 Tax=Mucilaginibacter mali TaxID=2740462 RepID=A0A7D4QHZ2_9SPHI|nr:hypothetical protein [Mucilaginibacter mali]QKJ28790.1 hypothetical protein HQ865_03115 [Mucilaginibacter mali]